MNAKNQKQRNTKWTFEQKKQILEYSSQNERMCVSDLCVLIEQDLGYSIKRRTLQHYISNRDKVLSLSDRKTGGRHADLEQALFLWITYARNDNLILTNDILIEKAKRLSIKLGNIPNNFKYSIGWLERFKDRFKIKRRLIHGEAGDVNLDIYKEEIKSIKDEICKYDKDDVYNMDEAALFYEMLPSQTLSMTAKISGTKQSKKRITLVFCTNMTGTDKHVLSIIAHSAKPRCFKNFNHNSYVDYFHNKKAWMTSTIFNDWVQRFDLHVGKKNKKVLLLLDNAPSHILLSEPKNVKIIFLPPCTTSKLQPLDGGIIRTFKAYYKRKICLFAFENFENEIKQNVSFKDVIKWLKECWNNISEDTIQRCWKHVGLYGEDLKEIDKDMTCAAIEESSLQEIIDKLNVKSKLTAHDYIQAEDNHPTTSIMEMTEDDIIDFIKENSDEGNKDNLLEDSLCNEYETIKDETVPKAEDCKAALEQLEKFFNDKDLSNKKDMDAIYYLKNRIDSVKILKQATMYNFLTKL